LRPRAVTMERVVNVERVMGLTDDEVYAYIAALKADIKYLNTEIEKCRDKINGKNNKHEKSLTVLDIFILVSLFSILW